MESTVLRNFQPYYYIYWQCYVIFGLLFLFWQDFCQRKQITQAIASYCNASQMIVIMHVMSKVITFMHKN